MTICVECDKKFHNWHKDNKTCYECHGKRIQRGKNDW